MSFVTVMLFLGDLPLFEKHGVPFNKDKKIMICNNMQYCIAYIARHNALTIQSKYNARHISSFMILTVVVKGEFNVIGSYI